MGQIAPVLSANNSRFYVSLAKKSPDIIKRENGVVSVSANNGGGDDHHPKRIEQSKQRLTIVPHR